MTASPTARHAVLAALGHRCPLRVAGDQNRPAGCYLAVGEPAVMLHDALSPSLLKGVSVCTRYSLRWLCDVPVIITP
jgi:hypothetical protein